jgi:hypothetical protein
MRGSFRGQVPSGVGFTLALIAFAPGFLRSSWRHWFPDTGARCASNRLGLWRSLGRLGLLGTKTSDRVRDQVFFRVRSTCSVPGSQTGNPGCPMDQTPVFSTLSGDTGPHVSPPDRRRILVIMGSFRARHLPSTSALYRRDGHRRNVLARRGFSCRSKDSLKVFWSARSSRAVSMRMRVCSTPLGGSSVHRSSRARPCDGRRSRPPDLLLQHPQVIGGVGGKTGECLDPIALHENAVGGASYVLTRSQEGGEGVEIGRGRVIDEGNRIGLNAFGPGRNDGNSARSAGKRTASPAARVAGG